MKRTPLRKKRKFRSERDILKDKAWSTFSKWVRKRDGKCVTCGGKPENAGHYWHGVLDFDEMNINAQCVRCNKWLHGNLGVYSIYLINKYGWEAFKGLEIRHYQAIRGKKLSEDDYQALIDKYSLV